MKHKILIVTLLFFSIGFTQDSTLVKAETPKIVSKLQLGKSLNFNDVEIKFVEVLQDSRCPKGATCIWAGEVVVLVEVFKNGKFLEKKKLIFNPGNHLKKELLTLFSSEKLNINGFNISPHPVAGEKISPQDYYLQIEIEN